jgi:5-methyltetrahydrofolate corrinoid/iron sulfur protein methyltransferase
MLTIAENINVMNRQIGAAIEARDKLPVQGLARRCVAAGADILDINLGPARKEGAQKMIFMVDAVAEISRLQLSLDTTNAEAMEAGIVRCGELGLPTPIVNSFSAQTDKMENILPLAATYGCEVIGLTMGAAVPIDANERLALAYELVTAAGELGIPSDRIYIDPILIPLGLGTGQQHAEAVQEVLRTLPDMFDPQVKTTCGLSNVSNGAPPELRPVINNVFASMIAALGMSSAILDVLDKETMRTIRLLAAFAGKRLFSISDAELG